MSGRWPKRNAPQASAPQEPPLRQSAPVAGGQQTNKRGRGRPRRDAQPEVLAPSAPSSNLGQSHPATGAGGQAPPPAEDDIAGAIEDVDSDSDDDLMGEVAEQALDERSVIEVMINATATRIQPVTRKLYDSHLRQMAVWCLSGNRFRHCVGADGNMIVPLDSDAMIMFTEHLIQKQVPWAHAQVPGTTKHLAVKTVTNFFAAAGFTFAMRNEKVPHHVAQYFCNTKKAYTLKIARLKDVGLHPDSTNSIGINFSVYERICSKLGGYVAHFRGSCYSCWRDLWLYWVLLFNLLGRCFQVSKICYEMIWWQDDALVIKVPSQKGAYTASTIHHHTPLYTHRHTPTYSAKHSNLVPSNDGTAHTPPHRHTPSCIVTHHTPPYTHRHPSYTTHSAKHNNLVPSNDGTAHTPPHCQTPSCIATPHTPPYCAKHKVTKKERCRTGSVSMPILSNRGAVQYWPWECIFCALLRPICLPTAFSRPPATYFAVASPNLWPRRFLTAKCLVCQFLE